MPNNKIQYHQQTKNIKRGYVYLLWFMSLLTLFAVYVVTDAVLSHRADSRLINVADRQRMRMEQIVKHILWISASKEEERIFTKTTIDISKPTSFYLSSDGYLDQFGGENNRKFMSKQFKDLLLQHADLPMSQQKEIITHTFEAWKKDGSQIDDVLVIGVRV